MPASRIPTLRQNRAKGRATRPPLRRTTGKAVTFAGRTLDYRAGGRFWRDRPRANFIDVRIPVSSGGIFGTHSALPILPEGYGGGRTHFGFHP